MGSTNSSPFSIPPSSQTSSTWDPARYMQMGVEVSSIVREMGSFGDLDASPACFESEITEGMHVDQGGILKMGGHARPSRGRRSEFVRLVEEERSARRKEAAMQDARIQALEARVAELEDRLASPRITPAGTFGPQTSDEDFLALAGSLSHLSPLDRDAFRRRARTWRDK